MDATHTTTEARASATHDDLVDTEEIVEVWCRRMDDRHRYRNDRITSAAARRLCASRGHVHGLRGCATCRADIATVAP